MFWREDDIFSFDRGRVLQSLVILVAAFRSNDDYLKIFEQTGKKKEAEMKNYMVRNVVLHTAISFLFGTCFYLRNYEQFKNADLNLENGFYGFKDNTYTINCVSFTNLNFHNYSISSLNFDL